MKDTHRVSVLKIDKSQYPTQYWNQIAEILILSGLGHSNLITVRDAFQAKSSSNLVMELEPMDRTFPLEVPYTTFLKGLAQVIVGLQHLHRNGFAHSDLKPENILAKKTQVKLADLGLVVYYGYQTDENVRCNGTAIYAAPECDSKRYTNVSAKSVSSLPTLSTLRTKGLLSDTWAVGTLMYEYAMVQNDRANDLFDLPDGTVYFFQYDDEDSLPRFWKREGKRYLFEGVQPPLVSNCKPLTASELKAVLGEDGFHIMQACMNPDADDRPTMTELIRMLSLTTMQKGGSMPPLLTQGRAHMLQTGKIANDLKLCNERRTYLDSIRYDIAGEFPSDFANIGSWMVQVAGENRMGSEAVLFAAMAFKRFAQIHPIVFPKRVAIACLACSGIYKNSFLSMEQCHYLLRYEGTHSKNDIQQTVFQVVMTLVRTKYCASPRMHCLLDECVKYEQRHGKDPTLVAHAQGVAMYLAFFSPRVFDTQPSFVRNVLAATLLDLGRDRNTWPFAENIQHYANFVTAKRNPSFTFRPSLWK